MRKKKFKGKTTYAHKSSKLEGLDKIFEQHESKY